MITNNNNYSMKEKKNNSWERFFSIVGIVLMLLVVSCGKIVVKQGFKYFADKQTNNKLKSYIEEVNKKLPIRIDDLTTLEKFDLINDEFVYLYSVEQTVNFENIDPILLKNQIKSNIPEKTKKFFKDYNKNVVYRYKNEFNGETFEIKFNPNEF